jgi:bifunctional non-homologous end joining protein LigD
LKAKGCLLLTTDDGANPARAARRPGNGESLPPWPSFDHPPPVGEGWQFELKFDDWRLQLRKAGASSTLFGKNGGDLTRRFPRIAAVVLGLPANCCIIDGELIAVSVHGQPDFLPLLHGRRVPTCVYAFDLLELQGRVLRDRALVQRRARLQALLARAKSDLLRSSESFADTDALQCSRRGLEHRGEAQGCALPLRRSGTRSGWIKVKTSEWKGANRWRGEFFEKEGRG